MYIYMEYQTLITSVRMLTQYIKRSQECKDGCNDAAPKLFVARAGYDEAAQIQLLFAEPIEWSDHATHLSWMLWFLTDLSPMLGRLGFSSMCCHKHRIRMICLYIRDDIFSYLLISIYIPIYLYLYSYLYLHIYVSIYIYIYVYLFS